MKRTLTNPLESYSVTNNPGDVNEHLFKNHSQIQENPNENLEEILGIHNDETGFSEISVISNIQLKPPNEIDEK